MILITLFGWYIFHFLLSFIIPIFLPEGSFPYQLYVNNFHIIHSFSSLADFDGAHYLLISERGYGEFEQAFFPLYPILVHFLTPLFKNGLVAGLLISNISFIAALIIFKKYLEIITKHSAVWVILFILAFPTSFFFMGVYTEGLFFLLTALTLFLTAKRQYYLAGITGYFAAVTRLIGIFLVIPMATAIYFDVIHKRKISKHYFYTLSLLGPALGLVNYCVYLWITTGDPFFFFSSQPSFGANRSTHLISLPQVIYRYIKIFITADHTYQYFISLVEFSVFMLVFITLLIQLYTLIKNVYHHKLKVDFNLLGLNLFSLVTFLLPTATGTFSSIPRYALLSLSTFIALASIKQKVVKIVIIALFSILHIILYAFFMQGYFVG